MVSPTLLGIAQRVLDCGPVRRGHGGQHPFPLVVLQVFDHGGGVVGIQLLQRLGQGARRHAPQHLLADAVVQFRQRLGQQFGRQPQHHHRAMLGGQEAHQVGDIGGVQVFQQRTQPHAVAVVGGVDHLLDEGGGQDIVFVQRLVVFVDVGIESGGSFAHAGASLSRCESAW
jgi:hypothetical protein